MQYLSKLTRALTSAVVLVALVGTASPVAAAESKATGERTKTGMLSLRDSLKVSIVTAKKSGLDQNVQVIFRDANNEVLSRQRGTVGDDRKAFVAEISYDDLIDVQQPLVRVVVRVEQEAEVEDGTQCPTIITADSDSGPFLTWTSDSCDCGGAGTGTVFADCIGVPGDVSL